LYEQHIFWDTLWFPDHQFALRFVLQIRLNTSELRYRIKSGLIRVINQERDADILIALACESQSQAELVCRSITTYEKPSVCKIAYGILDCYPFNETIEGALVFSFTVFGGGFYEKIRKKLETQLEKIKAIQDDPRACLEVKSWIKKLELNLNRELKFLIDREY